MTDAVAVPAAPETEEQTPRRYRNYFKLIFEGYLTRDPEMRYSPAGNPITNMTVACNLPCYHDGETTIEPIWVRVTTFGKTAETTNEYLRKGSRVLVEAERVIFDPNTGAPNIFARGDGSAGASFEVPSYTVNFLSPPRNGEQPTQVTQMTDAEADLVFGE